MSFDPLQTADRNYSWHPFTSSDDDLGAGPLVIVRGEGEYLWDSRGNRYLDGNSSIWCNLHGHNHPRLNRALRDQLAKIAHSSFLGHSNEPASLLAKELIDTLHGPAPLGFPGSVDRRHLPSRVFFSDNGSCANEIAAKMAVQYFGMTGQPQRKLLVAFANAYHGDTMLNVSLGGVGTFSRPYESLMLRREEDGHTADSPQVILVEDAAEFSTLAETRGAQIAAVFLESSLHGAGGMLPHAPGFMTQVAQGARTCGALLIMDEVLAGFGRTGHFLGCYAGGFAPDFITLSKGLTGGYMPLAITLAPEHVYEAFSGDYYSGRLLYHGHTYTAHPLGCAVARENLKIFQEEDILAQVAQKIPLLESGLARLGKSPGVKEVRSIGLIGAVEMIPDKCRGDRARAICLAARAYGLLTRPVGDSIVLMPPYCISPENLTLLFEALEKAIDSIT
ncbi:MAG: adenosylmethionine--8-amino-7-oxononanoate transaminase [Verrucomicrobiota bacterium]|nr:adenosylmethionine--8-amino-7-oxononanoate transaminase [Verrucomicrobiota bacterium]